MANLWTLRSAHTQNDLCQHTVHVFALLVEPKKMRGKEINNYVNRPFENKIYEAVSKYDGHKNRMHV